jgi:hypothetical protein
VVGKKGGVFAKTELKIYSNNNQYKFCHITRLKRKYFILKSELYEQEHEKYNINQ